jgi:hypothetical protein
MAAGTGQEVRDAEFDAVLAGGAVHLMGQRGAPRFDEHGRVRGAIGRASTIAAGAPWRASRRAAQGA